MNLPETDLHGLKKSTIYGAIRQIIIFRPLELGVTAVPTFLFNHQRLVGVQNLETLEKLLLSNNVKRRNLKK